MTNQSLDRVKELEDLEQKLLHDESFQHILKFAPESQRELMTFELSKYFNSELQNLRTELAREAEAKMENLYEQTSGKSYSTYQGASNIYYSSVDAIRKTKVLAIIKGKS